MRRHHLKDSVLGARRHVAGRGRRRAYLLGGGMGDEQRDPEALGHDGDLAVLDEPPVDRNMLVDLAEYEARP